MPWNRSAIFREWLSSALAPRTGAAGSSFRNRSGWNLPADRDDPPAVPPFLGHEFRCLLFGDNIDTTATHPQGPAEAATGEHTCMFVPAATNPGSRWNIELSIPGGLAGQPPVIPQGGMVIRGTGQKLTAAGPPGFASAGTTITFGGDNCTSNGILTLAGIHGDFVYDFYSNTIGAAGLLNFQGLAFHWYGGEAGVLDGTFTVVWPTPERIAQLQLVA
jgi:hypothetical protein